MDSAQENYEQLAEMQRQIAAQLGAAEETPLTRRRRESAKYFSEQANILQNMMREHNTSRLRSENMRAVLDKRHPKLDPKDAEKVTHPRRTKSTRLVSEVMNNAPNTEIGDEANEVSDANNVLDSEDVDVEVTEQIDDTIEQQTTTTTKRRRPTKKSDVSS